MVQQDTEDLMTEHIGRFQIGVPTTLEPVYEAYALRDAGIDVHPWPQEAGADYERLWRERMEKIRATENVDRRTFAEILEQGELVPGVRVVVYRHPSRAEGTLNAEALLQRDGRAVWLSASMWRDSQDRLPEELKALFRSLVDSLRNVEQRPELKREPGQFFVRTHALQVPPVSDAGYERAEVRFVGALRNGARVGEAIDLTFNFSLTGRPAPETRLERHRKSRSWLLQLGMRQRTLRAGTRLVAGMPGDELIVRMREEDGETLSFEWEFNGEAGSAVRPRTIILMSGSPREQRALTALWDAILDSIEPVP
jgi:hypothetical protein